MKEDSYNRNSFIRAFMAIMGIVLNLAPHMVAEAKFLPVSFGFAGTMLVTIVCGSLPGMLTATMSTIIQYLIYSICVGTEYASSNIPVYQMLGMVIALLINWYVSSDVCKKKRNLLWLIPLMTVICALLNVIITMLTMQNLVGGDKAGIKSYFDNIIGLLTPEFFGMLLLYDLLFSLVDILFAMAVSFVISLFIPADMKKAIKDGRWKQRPLDITFLKKIRERMLKTRKLSENNDECGVLCEFRH